MSSCTGPNWLNTVLSDKMEFSLALFIEGDVKGNTTSLRLAVLVLGWIELNFLFIALIISVSTSGRAVKCCCLNRISTTGAS